MAVMNQGDIHPGPTLLGPGWLCLSSDFVFKAILNQLPQRDTGLSLMTSSILTSKA